MFSTLKKKSFFSLLSAFAYPDQLLFNGLKKKVQRPFLPSPLLPSPPLSSPLSPPLSFSLPLKIF